MGSLSSAKYFPGGSPVMFGLVGGKKKHPEREAEAWKSYYANENNRASLKKELADYSNIPLTLRDQYTQAAKRAGTYGNTPEFEAGLNSEVQAGTRGAKTEAAARINALHRALGEAEDFKPDVNPSDTGGNVTQDTLRNAPTPSPAPVATTNETPQAAPGEESESASPIMATARPGIKKPGSTVRSGALKRAY